MKPVSAQYKMLAGISYFFWPISILIVATKLKKDRFLRFHGYQALFLGISGTVFYLVSGVFLRLIPGLGESLFNLLASAWIVMALFLAFRCLLGDYFKVPFIYDVAYWDME
ncbi:MAG: DUF4870 domain-containing protein [Firmicutes bacterium]|nr:DUF4870 domain-containing protein [Bacillota bacterium]